MVESERENRYLPGRLYCCPLVAHVLCLPQIEKGREERRGGEGERGMKRSLFYFKKYGWTKKGDHNNNKKAIFYLVEVIIFFFCFGVAYSGGNTKTCSYMRRSPSPRHAHRNTNQKKKIK